MLGDDWLDASDFPRARFEAFGALHPDVAPAASAIHSCTWFTGRAKRSSLSVA